MSFSSIIFDWVKTLVSVWNILYQTEFQNRPMCVAEIHVELLPFGVKVFGKKSPFKILIFTSSDTSPQFPKDVDVK